MTTPRSLTITTGSRLHFGMFSFGHPGTRQFGGVGAMIDLPGVCVQISPADRLTAQGPLAERALDAARRVMRAWGETGDLPCSLQVLNAPRPHVGLGVGTQLALAVSRLLHALFERDFTDVEELAQRAGRGLRSAIGLHGFQHGGLLMEGGKSHQDPISPLIARLELPPAWRWVLVRHTESHGLSGAEEQAAFARLPPVPEELTMHLCREALLELLPAAASQEFDSFSRSLFRFGQLAGRCFQSQQAGIYATRETGALVEQIRGEGIKGVGQSSWGPTLFAVTESEADAKSLADWLGRQSELEIGIARPLNHGARLELSE
jgi:beta-RFAP synthase